MAHKLTNLTIRIFIILFILNFNNCSINFGKKDDEKKDIHGILTLKYIDMDSHGSAVIEYKMDTVNYKFCINHWGRKNDMWGYLKIGDSIIKPSGSLTIRVKKNEGSYKDYEYQP